MQSEKLDCRIREQMTAYYTDYYRNCLGLKDYEKRIQARFEEEERIGNLQLQQIESLISFNFSGKKVLVVGAGTGAECMALVRRGALVCGIEPAFEALNILHLKAQREGIDPVSFSPGMAESLPYPEGAFDFVYCFTVLEHVRNVGKAVDEMVRVLKPGGWLYIVTPDYRQFYEPHYKLHLPMFAPKWFVKICLRLLGRPTAFMDGLQMVNSRQVSNLLQDRALIAMQIRYSWPRSWKTSKAWGTRLIMKLTRLLEIQRDQYWLAQKMSQPR